MTSYKIGEKTASALEIECNLEPKPLHKLCEIPSHYVRILEEHLKLKSFIDTDLFRRRQ